MVKLNIDGACKERNAPGCGGVIWDFKGILGSS